MSSFTPSRDGGPAFPRSAAEHSQGGHYEQDGMSLREWYAGKALAGLVEMHHGIGVDPRATAIAAVQFADALIDALTEGRSTPSDSEGV